MTTAEETIPVYLTDASVFLATYFPDEEITGAKTVLRQFGEDSCELVIVELTTLEVTNGVLLAGRRDRIQHETASRIIKNFRALNLDTIDPAGIQDVYRTGEKYALTAYDAQYVATAIKEDIPLITADRTLWNSLPEDMDSVIWINEMC